MKNETQTVAERIEALKNKQLNDSLELLKSVVVPQEHKLIKQLNRFINRNLTDTLYPNHLNREDIKVINSYIDYETLEDCIFSNGEVTENETIHIRTDTEINGVEVGFGVWVTIENKMQIGSGDFMVTTPTDDCESNIKRNMVYEFLEVINESLENAIRH